MQSPIDHLIHAALAEDIGPGDRTTSALVGGDVQGHAVLLAKSPGTIAGIEIAERVFAAVDPNLAFEPAVEDGAAVSGARDILARISGSLASILIAERTALNFIQRMSGVATLAAQFVEAAGETGARIVDTRKTIPGLRALDKYAVTVGGAANHRFGLFDGILIKDNHIAAVGGLAPAIALARVNAPHTLRIEVECKTLAQVDEALSEGADAILLDNMSLDQLRQAVRRIDGQAITEASGGVSLATVRQIAETGVDLISVGALTHSAVAMDISLDIEATEQA